MRWIVGLIFVLGAAMPGRAEEINPDKMPDPLNKIFFGARMYTNEGPVRSMQIEVGTAQECIENMVKALAGTVPADTKAIEVRCIKERNVEKPL